MNCWNSTNMVPKIVQKKKWWEAFTRSEQNLDPSPSTTNWFQVLQSELRMRAAGVCSGSAEVRVKVCSEPARFSPENRQEVGFKVLICFFFMLAEPKPGPESLRTSSNWFWENKRDKIFWAVNTSWQEQNANESTC